MTDLDPLKQIVSELPPQCQEQLAPVVEKLSQSYDRRSKVLDLIQVALAQLRVDIKYLVFDLEATRRERDEYKAELEKK
jgi:hypothetical protein